MQHNQSQVKAKLLDRLADEVSGTLELCSLSQCMQPVWQDSLLWALGPSGQARGQGSDAAAHMEMRHPLSSSSHNIIIQHPYLLFSIQLRRSWPLQLTPSVSRSTVMTAGVVAFSLPRPWAGKPACSLVASRHAHLPGTERRGRKFGQLWRQIAPGGHHSACWHLLSAHTSALGSIGACDLHLPSLSTVSLSPTCSPHCSAGHRAQGQGPSPGPATFR